MRAAPVLLIHNSKPKVFEIDAVANEGVGANADLDVPRGQALLHCILRLGLHGALQQCQLWPHGLGHPLHQPLQIVQVLVRQDLQSDRADGLLNSD